VVGERLRRCQGVHKWAWKGKPDQDWLSRRTRGLHTGFPCRATSLEEYEAPQKMFDSALSDETCLQESAAGSFGTLYRTRRVADRKEVVIKVVEVCRAAYHKEVLLEICMHEVVCQHPNIVGYFGAYQEDEDHFALVLEAYDMSLERWLQSASFPTSRGGDTEIFASQCVATADILEGLGFLHALGKTGVIHRDIKPANVLLRCQSSAEGSSLGPILKACITDFGFTCLPGSDHESPGTPMYMSPELLKKAPYGQAVDMWALGLTLIELWTGILPAMAEEECKLRLGSEYHPPNQLGPYWEGRHQLLDHCPYIQFHIRRCFLVQRDRVKVDELRAALSMANLRHAWEAAWGYCETLPSHSIVHVDVSSRPPNISGNDGAA